jgi:hypothetical protein
MLRTVGKVLSSMSLWSASVLRENIERKKDEGAMPVYWQKRARHGTTTKWSYASSSLSMGLYRIGTRWRTNDKVVMLMIDGKKAPQGVGEARTHTTLNRAGRYCASSSTLGLA